MLEDNAINIERTKRLWNQHANKYDDYYKHFKGYDEYRKDGVVSENEARKTMKQEGIKWPRNHQSEEFADAWSCMVRSSNVARKDYPIRVMDNHSFVKCDNKGG